MTNKQSVGELAEKLTEAYMNGLGYGYSDASSIAQWYHNKEDREDFREQVKKEYLQQLKQEWYGNRTNTAN